MAISNGTRPNQSNQPASKLRISLVIGIAAVALIAGLFAFTNYDWNKSSVPNPQLESAKNDFVAMSRELPEVRSFLQAYPNAKSEININGYSYDPSQANLTAYDVSIKYSTPLHIENHEKGISLDPSISVSISKSASGVRNAGGTFEAKPYHGYHYFVIPECIVYPTSLDKPMIGFPNGTAIATLYRDCKELAS